MSKKDIVLVIMVYIKNVIALICFTFLAVVFQKWWIVLFSILFWSSVSTRKVDDD